MKTIPEMKELTIEVKDGVVVLRQATDTYRFESVKIPVSMWDFILCSVGDEIADSCDTPKEPNHE